MYSKLHRPDPRWVSLFACLCLEAVAGSSYAFSLYSNQLKAELNYTQEQVETAGAVGNLGLYLSIVAGLCFDSLGPSWTGLIGAALVAVGYATTWGAAQGLIPSPVALTALYFFLWSHGSAWLDTVAVGTTVKNFRSNKATVLGLAKALFGLCASMMTIVYTNLFKPDVNSFLLFLAIAIPVVAVPASLATRLASNSDASEPVTHEETRKLLGGFALLAGLMAYCAAVGLAQANGQLGALPALAYLIIPLILAQSVLLLPCGARRKSEKMRGKVTAVRVALLRGDGNLDAAIDAVESKEASGRLLEGHEEEGGEEGGDTAGALQAAASDASGASFVEGAFSFDFPMIMLTVRVCFFTRKGGASSLPPFPPHPPQPLPPPAPPQLFTGTGSGLVVINNLGQITKALGASADGADVYVMLLSIANCLGRLVIGAISDGTARHISRPAWLAIAVASMGGSQVLASFADLNSLYAVVVWTGASYGMFWSLGPALISDRFGQANFASIYSLSSVSTGLASYLLSAIMAGALYQAHTPAGSTTCLGAECYKTTFIILAGMCGAGTLSALLLAYRLKGLYGPDGRAVSYRAWAATETGRPSALARAIQRRFANSCCCRCGRRLLLSDDQFEELAAEGAAPHGSAKQVSTRFEKDLRNKELAAEWK